MLLITSSLLLSLLIHPACRQLAVRHNWLASSANRLGASPCLTGGVGILLTIITALLLFGETGLGSDLSHFWTGLLVVFAMGIADDIQPLGPGTKLGFQILAASIFLLPLPLDWWIPLYLLWLVFIINALNLLDNMDGLAGGVGLIAALTLSRLSPNGEEILLVLAGSLAGFVAYNFPPGRIFLGDSGSHLIGYTLGALSLKAILSVSTPSWGDLLAFPLVLAVPILDTVFVILSRWKRGDPITRGGKDHLSHFLLNYGFSERKVDLIFYTVTTVFSLSALILA